jgi:hypothetical protein
LSLEEAGEEGEFKKLNITHHDPILSA